MAHYLETAPDIFEICCVDECGRDATVSVAAHLKNKQTLYLPSCTHGSHVGKVLAVQIELVEIGIPIREIKGIVLEEVFIKKRNEGLKCKLLQWEADNKPKKKKNAPASRPILPKKRKSKTAVDLTTNAIQNWQWIEDMDRWMSVKGAVLPIKSLLKPEWISAITAICSVNLSRISKKNAWVDKIRTRTPKYEYPEGPMKVGSAMASEKLEEFQDVGLKKGWL